MGKVFVNVWNRRVLSKVQLYGKWTKTLWREMFDRINDVYLFREILVQLFEKYQLNIEKCNICLRSAPTLPLSLDQPVKHLLLDDLVVTGIKKNFVDWWHNFLFSRFLPFFSNYGSKRFCLILSFSSKSLGAYTRNIQYTFNLWCNIWKNLHVSLLLLFIEA